jgi:hypothetical protein
MADELYRLPIETTPRALIEEALGEMESLIPGWDRNLGEYEVMLFEGIVWRLIWPFIQLASGADLRIFNEWGRQIVKVNPQEATRATATSTWTVKDEAGYTIKAGTQVDIARSGDERIGFLVTADVAVPAGATQTAPGEVVLEAIEPGLSGNGLGGDGILIDAFFFVDGIAIEGVTAGGEDAEDPRRYIARLSETMQTFIEGVVIARDVAIVARNVAGIGRATVLDNFNADTEEDEQEKTTTVAVTDPSGEPATVEAKARLVEVLEAKREVNYLFFVVDATYHDIDVEGDIVPSRGYDKPSAAANAAAMVASLLDPATHGQQPPGNAASWENVDTLRYQDLVAAVNAAEGVDHYTSLKWRKGAEAFGIGDIGLTGIAPLPRPDSIVFT